MAIVHCARCGADAEGLPEPPFPSPFGKEVQEKICGACWAAWEDMRVKVINEYRINLGLAEHRTMLVNITREFLNLPAPEKKP
ncbi:MAG: Fe(2+)-trafficking protein [Leptospirillia bacterium]